MGVAEVRERRLPPGERRRTHLLQGDDVAPPPGERGRLLDDAADPALDVPGEDDGHQSGSHRRVSGDALMPCTAMETMTTTATVQKMIRVSPSLNAPTPMTTDA